MVVSLFHYPDGGVFSVLSGNPMLVNQTSAGRKFLALPVILCFDSVRVQQL